MSIMWSHFYKGTVKRNSSHWNMYCKGCIKHEQKLLQDTGTYNSIDWLNKGPSFIAGDCERVGSVQGDKSPWITHILGGKDITPCPHASNSAKKLAITLRAPKLIRTFTQADVDVEQRMMPNHGIECSDDEYYSSEVAKTTDLRSKTKDDTEDEAYGKNRNEECSKLHMERIFFNVLE
ncbi:hypothetical protein C8R45DRAFT_927719 [Mycena sanguinolenta]|nr:hypothetical protein C8R45DRAFT_927719 [Mycena sanguinolenta]